MQKNQDKPLVKIQQEIIDEIHQLVPTAKIEIIKVQHGLMFNVQQPYIINIVMISDDELETPFLTIKTNDKLAQNKLNHWCHNNEDINSWFFL